MDLLGVLRACVRRWYVFLPVLAVTLWFCAQQYQQAVPTYTSNASVVIAPSAALTYNKGRQAETGRLITSPFGGGEGPRVLTGLLARALNTEVEQAQLLPEGGATISAAREVEEDATVVQLQVVSEDLERDVAAMAAVRQGVDGVLRDIQLDAGAQDWELYTAVSGGPVDPPLVAYPSRVRGVVAIGLAGTLVAVVLSVLAQSLMGGRSRKKEKKRAHATAAHAATPDSDTAVTGSTEANGANPGRAVPTEEQLMDLRELQRSTRSS